MTTVDFPPLLIDRSHPVGRIIHLLSPSREHHVVEVSEIAISTRRREILWVMSTGERFIATSRLTCRRPDGVAGVLRRSGKEPLQWLSHALLDQALIRVDQSSPLALRDETAGRWPQQFRYVQERVDANNKVVTTGLRPPQLGALFAVGAHWSLHHTPATIIMPTGTGKTETMLASTIAFSSGVVLVVVPSDVLRSQTAHKFISLGLLYKLGLIPPDCVRPVVGILTRRPRTVQDLDIFDKCNVVVGTASSLAQGSALALGSAIAARVSTLIVDEAHHVAARTWSEFRKHFVGKRVLQFTATPFRRDGKLLDGEVIYNYPLRRAQDDLYFKPITFEPVWELDRDKGDRCVAQSAIDKLRGDRQQGLNHLALARCDNITRARSIHSIYQQLAPEFAPVLIHSESPSAQRDLEQLKDARSKVVVCVDMLGEGFDLPQLKIAAIHDTHKSLSVLLQFVGRFTRVAGADIGNATAIANIANRDVSDALERLYSEDADWNQLLSEASSRAVKEHTDLVEFLNNSDRLGQSPEDDVALISSSLLRPKFSFVAYRTIEFRPNKFIEAMSKQQAVVAAWHNRKSNTLFFVTRSDAPVQWSKSKEILDRQWDLFVVHHDPARGLLYIHSSDKSTLHEGLAKAISEGSAKLLYGDQVFRSLGGIARLRFQNIGIKKHGRRNLRYAMYTGADVESALSVSQRAGSTKANLSGSGFRGGQQVDVGCSFRGRVWCKDHGSLKSFTSWCEQIGQLLIDDTIETADILKNVLAPEEVTELPDRQVLAIEWPHEVLSQSEERVIITDGTAEHPLSIVELRYNGSNRASSELLFKVLGGSWSSDYALVIGSDGGFHVEQTSGPELRLKIGRLDLPLQEYLSSYPPLVIFVDLSELDGSLVYATTDTRTLTLPAEQFEPWDWTGVDVRKESLWSGGRLRADTIQARASDRYIADGFEIVFDDDASGEAADLVCIKEEADCIRLALVHCKFTTATRAGERVKDVVEVSSQAVRSGKWVPDFKRLCRHILNRDDRLNSAARPSRFLAGTRSRLSSILRASRFKTIKPEIVIVQPGLSRSDCTSEQSAVLAAAYSYLLDTVGVRLGIKCSH